MNFRKAQNEKKNIVPIGCKKISYKDHPNNKMSDSEDDEDDDADEDDDDNDDEEEEENSNTTTKKKRNNEETSVAITTNTPSTCKSSEEIEKVKLRSYHPPNSSFKSRGKCIKNLTENYKDSIVSDDEGEEDEDYVSDDKINENDDDDNMSDCSSSSSSSSSSLTSVTNDFDENDGDYDSDIEYLSSFKIDDYKKERNLRNNTMDNGDYESALEFERNLRRSSKSSHTIFHDMRNNINQSGMINFVLQSSKVRKMYSEKKLDVMMSKVRLPKFNISKLNFLPEYETISSSPYKNDACVSLYSILKKNKENVSKIKFYSGDITRLLRSFDAMFPPSHQKRYIDIFYNVNTECTVQAYPLISGLIHKRYKMIAYCFYTQLMNQIKNPVEVEYQDTVTKKTVKKKMYLEGIQSGEVELYTYLYWQLSCKDLESWRDDNNNEKLKLLFSKLWLDMKDLSDRLMAKDPDCEQHKTLAKAVEEINSFANFDKPQILTAVCIYGTKCYLELVYNLMDYNMRKEWCVFFAKCNVYPFFSEFTFEAIRQNLKPLLKRIKNVVQEDMLLPLNNTISEGDPRTQLNVQSLFYTELFLKKSNSIASFEANEIISSIRASYGESDTENDCDDEDDDERQQGTHNNKKHKKVRSRQAKIDSDRVISSKRILIGILNGFMKDEIDTFNGDFITKGLLYMFDNFIFVTVHILADYFIRLGIPVRGSVIESQNVKCIDSLFIESLFQRLYKSSSRYPYCLPVIRDEFFITKVRDLLYYRFLHINDEKSLDYHIYTENKRRTPETFVIRTPETLINPESMMDIMQIISLMFTRIVGPYVVQLKSNYTLNPDIVKTNFLTNGNFSKNMCEILEDFIMRVTDQPNYWLDVGNLNSVDDLRKKVCNYDEEDDEEMCIDDGNLSEREVLRKKLKIVRENAEEDNLYTYLSDEYDSEYGGSCSDDELSDDDDGNNEVEWLNKNFERNLLEDKIRATGGPKYRMIYEHPGQYSELDLIEKRMHKLEKQNVDKSIVESIEKVNTITDKNGKVISSVQSKLNRIETRLSPLFPKVQKCKDGTTKTVEKYRIKCPLCKENWSAGVLTLREHTDYKDGVMVNSCKRCVDQLGKMQLRDPNFETNYIQVIIDRINHYYKAPLAFLHDANSHTHEWINNLPKATCKREQGRKFYNINPKAQRIAKQDPTKPYKYNDNGELLTEHEYNMLMRSKKEKKNSETQMRREKRKLQDIEKSQKNRDIKKRKEMDIIEKLRMSEKVPSNDDDDGDNNIQQQDKKSRKRKSNNNGSSDTDGVVKIKKPRKPRAPKDPNKPVTKRTYTRKNNNNANKPQYKSLEIVPDEYNFNSSSDEEELSKKSSDVVVEKTVVPSVEKKSNSGSSSKDKSLIHEHLPLLDDNEYDSSVYYKKHSGDKSPFRDKMSIKKNSMLILNHKN